MVRRHGNKDAAKYRARYLKAVEEMEAVTRIYEASRRRAVARRIPFHGELEGMYTRDFLEQLDLRKVFHGDEIDQKALKAEVAAYNKEMGSDLFVSDVSYNSQFVDLPINSSIYR